MSSSNPVGEVAVPVLLPMVVPAGPAGHLVGEVMSVPAGLPSRRIRMSVPAGLSKGLYGFKKIEEDWKSLRLHPL